MYTALPIVALVLGALLGILINHRVATYRRQLVIAAIAYAAGICAGISIVAPAHADTLHAFKWARTYDVPETVAISVASVSDYKLKQLAAQYNSHDSAQALSVLHKRGDQWSCEIFIGRTADRAAALAHEERHCHGWSHE